MVLINHTHYSGQVIARGFKYGYKKATTRFTSARKTVWLKCLRDWWRHLEVTVRYDEQTPRDPSRVYFGNQQAVWDLAAAGTTRRAKWEAQLTSWASPTLYVAPLGGLEWQAIGHDIRASKIEDPAVALIKTYDVVLAILNLRPLQGDTWNSAAHNLPTALHHRDYPVYLPVAFNPALVSQQEIISV